MSAQHVVQMHKSVWILKIVELVLAVLILALSAVSVAGVPYDAAIFALFSALFTIIILIYYFVALHGSQQLYNWIALLVLECVAVVFWLSAWAALAALYAVLVYLVTVDGDTIYVNGGLADAYVPVTIAAMALCVVQFIIYCVSLGLMGAAIHRHRKSGYPMKEGEARTWPDAAHHETGEKNEMNTMQTPPAQNAGHAQQAQAQPAPPYAQPTYDAAPQSHYSPSSIVSPYPAPTPPPQNAHEVPGSNRYT